MKHTLSYIKLILTDLKLIFSHFMTGENTDYHSGKVKTAPIYQMEAYQKTPPKVKHTDITQKSPKTGPSNWKTSKVCKKSPAKSKKNSKTFQQTLQY